MAVTWQMYAIVCPLIFLASFVDSVAGGGGLISLPAYYMAGLSPYLAAGTNKLSACVGTVASAARYTRRGHVRWQAAIPAALAALPGSWLGASLQQRIPENTVRIMMVCLIPLIAVAVLGNGRKKETAGLLPANAPRWGFLAVSLAIGLVIGFYDGLVGPGTGTFLILLFTALMGMEAVDASGSAKLVNLASNIAALVTYLINGNVLIALGLPAACCSVCGGLLGAGVTIKRGTGFIRKMLIAVLALLLAKMIYDILA